MIEELKYSINNQSENYFQKLLNENNKDNQIKKKEIHNNNHKIIHILFLITLIFFIDKSEKDYKNYIMKKGEFLPEGFINENFYTEFEKTKENYIKYPELEPYLNQIKILSHVYHSSINIAKKNKTNVHVSMALNGDYDYPILVSICSALENCILNKTFLTYHIFVGPEITNFTIYILRSLITKYPFNFEIIFYDMGNTFIELYNKRMTQATYYRLLAPVIINEDKLIYLDGDTLVLNDLSEMYQYPFGKNYVLGFLDFGYNSIDYLGIYTDKYINAGVLLLNLEKIRKDSKVFEVLDIIKKKIYLEKEDQTLINYAFYPGVDRLPSKYVMFNFVDEEDVKIYLKNIRAKLEIEEFIEAIKNPTVIHLILCTPKVWFRKTRAKIALTGCKKRNDCKCDKDQNLWYYYAQQTYYYDEITKFYRIWK